MKKLREDNPADMNSKSGNYYIFLLKILQVVENRLS